MKKAPVKIWGVIAFCAMISCSHNESVPHGYIGIKKMGSILLDMQMAKAYSDSYMPDTVRRPESREKRIKTLYVQVLMLHHTNKDNFLKSYHFYEQHPDLMKKIYGLMQDSINKKSADADSARERRYRLQYPARRQGVKKTLNFLFLYQPFIDSVLSKPKRVFRPTDADSARERRYRLQYPARRQGVKKALNFLFLYQPFLDSVLPKPKRVFRPTDYERMKATAKSLKGVKDK